MLARGSHSRAPEGAQRFCGMLVDQQRCVCFRSVALWRKLGEPVEQANAEDNLAEAYLEQRDWQKAIAVLDAAGERLSGFEAKGRVARLLGYINEHRQAARAGRKEGADT